MIILIREFVVQKFHWVDFSINDFRCEGEKSLIKGKEKIYHASTSSIT
jgi:hypothetical protein